MEYLLKRYRKLNQKERKGFTLVELLVVIAILAVLASVSVVGYLGFTNKAKHSNAMTELSQAKEVIRAELIDNADHTYYFTKSGDTWTASTSEAKKDGTSQTVADTTSTTQPSLTLNYSNEKSLTYTFVDSITTTTTPSDSSTNTSTGSGLKWDDALKAIFTDLVTLNGEFYPSVNDNKTITTIKYYANNNGKAEWDVSKDTLSNGDSIADKGNETENKIVAATKDTSQE